MKYMVIHYTLLSAKRNCLRLFVVVMMVDMCVQRIMAIHTTVGVRHVHNIVAICEATVLVIVA